MKPKHRLILIALFNVIDTMATLYLTKTQNYIELNPLPKLLLQNPIVFAIVKITVIPLILLRLWTAHKDKRVQFVINIGFYLYGLLALYYLIIVPITFLTTK